MPEQSVSIPPRPVTPVGLLAQMLTQLSSRLADVSGIDPELMSQLREARNLAQGLDPYLVACTTPESAALARLAERTRCEDWSAAPSASGLHLEQEMLSGHVEGQLLKFLIHASRARRVLEIGMFTGYSALAMAEAVPADGVVVACELDPYVADFARRCFADSPVGEKIEVRVGPALQTLEQLASTGPAFDFVFIDADKAGYSGYLDFLLDGDLLAEHGVICVDNTLMQGEPYVGDGHRTRAVTANGAAIAAFNRHVADDPRVEQVLLPLRDGLTLIRRIQDPPAAQPVPSSAVPSSTLSDRTE